MLSHRQRTGVQWFEAKRKKKKKKKKKKSTFQARRELHEVHSCGVLVNRHGGLRKDQQAKNE